MAGTKVTRFGNCGCWGGPRNLSRCVLHKQKAATAKKTAKNCPMNTTKTKTAQ